MKNTDYTLDFPAPDESYKDVFNMVWFEAGRRYKLYWNSDAAAWRIVRQREKGNLWETVEEYASLWWALQGISCYKGPCEEETKELYGVIRQTLASQSLEEIEMN